MRSRVTRIRWPRGDGHAGIEQRRDAERQQPRRLRRGLRVEPARHAEDAGRRQRAQEHLPAVPRVQAVLGQRERAGARRRPGIDQRHLQDVETPGRPGQVRARFVVDERHAGMSGDPREVAIAAAQRADERLVDFDAGDPRVAGPDRGQDVASAADADDGDLAAPEAVRQRR